MLPLYDMRSSSLGFCRLSFILQDKRDEVGLLGWEVEATFSLRQALQARSICYAIFRIVRKELLQVLCSDQNKEDHLCRSKLLISDPSLTYKLSPDINSSTRKEIKTDTRF